MAGTVVSHGSAKAARKKKRKRKKENVGKEQEQLEQEEQCEEERKETLQRDMSFQLQRGSHSYGVQPLGNLLFATSRNVRDAGLGTMRYLTDEMVMEMLGLLEAADLARLALVSKALYVFCHQDSLWRSLVLEEFKGNFTFRSCWKSTYVGSLCRGGDPPLHVPLKVQNFYSDTLFQSWLCASLEIKEEWLSRDNIDRRTSLSVEEFIELYEEPGKPVIVTDVLAGWPALSRWQSRDYLVQHAGEVRFAAGPVDLELKKYFAYADSVQEERPLYLFDPKFGEKAPQLAADYEVPVYFREDLFSILGKDRPDYRWLILGPARSGSSFHIDPNSTSAWNAVVKGSKKWILYPPDVVPPGVHPSPDGAEVATPVSITEWFMNFYSATRSMKDKPVECICRAGEVMFIPNGWWHTVINLEDSIAITQNYVSRSNLLNVLEFLSRPNSKELVSGTTDRVNLYDKFRSKFEELHPGTIAELQQRANEKRAAALKKKKSSFWDSVPDTRSGAFKFGFS